MFEVVQNWFYRHCGPIGIDFGTDCLRLAQIEMRGNDAQLIAAASVDVPAPLRTDRAERISFLRDAVPELIQWENFRGRRAVLALPAASSFIQRFRLPSLDESELHAAVTAAVKGTMPADASELLIRHQLVQQTADGNREVIAIGAERLAVVEMLTALQQAGVDVIAMNTESGALADFHQHVYRRYNDRNATTAIIDIGFSGTRVIVMRNDRLVSAHSGLSGGRHITQAIADAMRIDMQAARMLRLKHSRTFSTSVSVNEQHVVFVAPSRSDVDLMQREHALLELAARPVIDSLGRALSQVKEQFECSENGSIIDRLLFVGGESRDRRLCERIARQVGVTACVGDPLLRMGRISNVCVKSGIDRRQAQPAWAVAIGLSLGPRDEAAVAGNDEMQDPMMMTRI